MIARSTLLCCSMRLKYCCTNSTQLSSCRSMALWTAAMVVSSIWNLALCAAAYGAHANNATLAAILTQRGFLVMISSPRVTDDRDRPRLTLEGNGRRGRVCHDDVGCKPTNSCASARIRLMSSPVQRRSIKPYEHADAPHSRARQ